MKMATGQKINERYLPESFYITLLGLYGLIYRVSFEDAILYNRHRGSINETCVNDYVLFDNGLCFNLFSDYGIGKKIENMIEDLLKNVELDFEKYKNDPFYKEILYLVPELIPIIRVYNAKKEIEWVHDYTTSSLGKNDEISSERLARLTELLIDVPDPMEISDDEYYMDISDEYCDPMEISEDEYCEPMDISEDFECQCNFCNEFRKYNRGSDADMNIILEVLRKIDQKVNG